jgi:hypothetical protein
VRAVCGAFLALLLVETRARWADRFGPAFRSAVWPLRAGHDVTVAWSGKRGATPARRRLLFDTFDTAVSLRSREPGTTRADRDDVGAVDACCGGVGSAAPALPPLISGSAHDMSE